LGAGTRVTARVSAHYESPVLPSWTEQVPELADQTILTHLDLSIELEADVRGAVTSYVEHAPSSPHRLRVKTAARGYGIPYGGGWWRSHGGVRSVELAVGTVVDETPDSVVFAGCGPPTSILRVRYQKRDWWVLVALYQLVPRPEGGSSLGGTEYL